DKPEGSQRGVAMQNEASTGAVYLQTNDAAKNEVVAYERSADGALTYLGAYETGGRGTGKPHLPSQSSVFLTEGGHWLLAVNPGGRTPVVTERGTNSISAYAIDERGYADGPTTIPSAGQTPYGFDFTDGGALVVTEAFGGDIGKAAASSYSVAAPGTLKPVSGSVADTRSEVCWAAVTKDDRFVYVTNFGDGTISSYGIGRGGEIELAEAVAASTRLGEAGIRDEAISSNGRFLYALDADAQKVHGRDVGADGRLAATGAFVGLPPPGAGLAAR